MDAPSQDSGASPQRSKPASAMKWQLPLGLVALWAAATLGLRLLSSSAWWLCALGGLGVVLVIWPGPKSDETPAKKGDA